MVGMSEQIKHFLLESMEAGWVDFTCNNKSLNGVNIKRGVFQGDSFHLCYLCSALFYQL